MVHPHFCSDPKHGVTTTENGGGTRISNVYAYIIDYYPDYLPPLIYLLDP
jgi:hypothetical protein